MNLLKQGYLQQHKKLNYLFIFIQEIYVFKGGFNFFFFAGSVV